jgi:ACS family hexuronate transporter-like MFS transporter
MCDARRRWLLLSLLFLSTAINYIDRQALAVVLPRLRDDLGITSVQYGGITTVFLIAYTLAQLASGVVIDRIGSRLGFALCVSIWSLAAAGHAFAAGAASLAALRFLLGMSEAGNWPAGAKVVAEWFPKERRAFAMGVFDGGSAVGAVVAPPIVALVAFHWGWREAFVVAGAFGVLWVAAWLAVYRLPGDAAPVVEAQPRGLRTDLRRLLRRRALLGLMLTRMAATPVWWFYVFWLPDYLSKDRGFSLKEIALFGWIPFLAVDVGKVVGGGLSDRLLASGWSTTLARKGVMGLGVLAIMGGAQVVEADTGAGALAWVSVATFGFGMWSANILALHADLFPAATMATAIGATGTAASLGGAAFIYATGWIVETRGYGPAFWVAGMAPLAAFLSLVFVLGKVEPPAPVEDRNLAS